MGSSASRTGREVVRGGGKSAQGKLAPGKLAPGRSRLPAKDGGRLSNEALELVAQRFRALGDPSRLALLQALMEGERTVGELCLVCPTSQANVSRHLALLHEEGVLARRKDGQHVHYRIADASISQLCELVCGSLSRRLDLLRDEFGVS
ncbi:MAG: ArsR/SmtB family transcription factor [Planctomycetia bacterium]